MFKYSKINSLSFLKNLFAPLFKKNVLRDVPAEWHNYLSVFSALGEMAILAEVTALPLTELKDYKILDVTEKNFKKLTGLTLNQVRGHLASQVFKLGQAPFLKEISTSMANKEKVVFDTYVSSYDKYLNVAVYGLTKKVFVLVLTDISEKKIKEIELNISQNLLDSIVSQTTDIIYRVDREGYITYVNEAIENYGFKTTDIIGKNIFDLVYPEDVEKAHYRLNDRRTGERSTKTLEIRLHSLQKEGYPFEEYLDEEQKVPYFEVNAEGQYMGTMPQSDHFIGTQGIMRDITQKKMALNFLQKSDEELNTLVQKRTHEASESLRKFSNIVKQMGNSVIITDKDGIIEYINPAFEAITGYSLSEVEGKNPAILKSGKHKNTFYKKMWNIILSGEIYRDVFINQRKNGELYYEEKTISPLKDIDGNITHFIATGKDITRSVIAENNLRDSENNYKALYDNNPSMVFKIDSNAKILSLNKYGAQKLGYTLDEIKNSSIYDLYHMDDKVPFKKHLDKCIAAPNKVFNSEFRIENKKGETIWVNETIQAAHGVNDQLIMFIVCNDITESKKNQVEKDELQSQLLQVQKMDAIGTLAGGIAHDFNNMLTVINGHAEVALLTTENDEPSHRHMISILKAGKRAENLTRQLLAFSRKQIFDPKILNLNNVIVDMDKMMRRLIGEDILIETVLDDTIPMIKGEPGQIEQILMNLIVNARDAIHENYDNTNDKKITIETSVAVLDEVYVSKHAGSRTGRYVMIALSDSGIGMSKEVKNKIFEPFFTTKNVGQGTGLGLSTVYGIVKQNGAFIYVNSEPLKGSTFKIYWPITKEKYRPGEVANPETADVTGTETILMVEDDESVRTFISGALAELGYKIHQAGDGEEALKAIHNKKFKPDLIVTDMIMPKMNGRELVSKIESIIPAIRVLYTSGYTDTYIVQKGELLQGINFIQKPFSIFNFAKKIREILDK